MTPIEAVHRLALEGRPAKLFERLCRQGCEPAALVHHLVALVRPPTLVARSERTTHRSNRRRRLVKSRLGDITGGFAEPPPRKGPMEQSLRPAETAQPTANFKTRELDALERQVRQAAEWLHDLIGGYVARQLAAERLSPALTFSLSERLTAYADLVIPAARLRGRPGPRQPIARRPARTIRWDHRPLDSLRTALGTVEPRELLPLERRLTKLASRMRALHASPRGVVAVESFAAFGLLPDIIDRIARNVVAEIGTHEMGPKRRPDTRRRLWALLDYVKARTGRYHDPELAGVLNAMRFRLADDELDDTGLRSWRSHHPRKKQDQFDAGGNSAHTELSPLGGGLVATPTVEAVLFDLGNTLVSYYTSSEFPDVLRRCLRGCTDVMGWVEDSTRDDTLFENAMRLNTERLDHQVRPLDARLQVLFGEGGTLDDIRHAALVHAFMAPIFEMARLDPDALEVLDALRARGIKTAIVSNTPWGSPAALWRTELHRHGLVDRVDAVVFCVDAGWRKPHPAPFMQALRLLGVEAPKAIFVGDDRRWDVKGARRSGLRPVLLQASTDQKAKEHVTIQRLRDLLVIVDSGR